MAKARGDRDTLDIFAWTPPSVAIGSARDETLTRAAHLTNAIARAVSLTLRETDRPQAEIAAAMSAYLGTTISENMVNAYASEGRADHKISLERAFALVHATGDPRLFAITLKAFGFAVIPARFLAAVEEAMCAETIDRATQQMKAARRRWKGGV